MSDINYTEMSDELQVKEIKEGPHSGATRYIHPSFGQISASRFSGNGSQFFGSDVKKHHGGVSLSIDVCELERDLSHDWYFGKKKVIEVRMSEVQWASLITNMNTSGTPCTIDWEHTRGRVEFPEMPDKFETYKHEYQNRLNSAFEDVNAILQNLRELVKGNRVNKSDINTLISLTERAQANVGGNMKYVHDKLCEEVDNIKVDAIKSIEGTILSKVQDMGIKAINQSGGASIKLLG